MRTESSTYDCIHLIIQNTFWRLAFGPICSKPYCSSITGCWVPWGMFMSPFCPWPWTLMLWCQMSWRCRVRRIPGNHSSPRRPGDNLTTHGSDCQLQKRATQPRLHVSPAPLLFGQTPKMPIATHHHSIGKDWWWKSRRRKSGLNQLLLIYHYFPNLTKTYGYRNTLLGLLSGPWTERVQAKHKLH